MTLAKQPLTLSGGLSVLVNPGIPRRIILRKAAYGPRNCDPSSAWVGPAADYFNVRSPIIETIPIFMINPIASGNRNTS
jgi:hypothetical protein